VHFFAWYVWQFMGPVLEKGAATSATLTDSNGA
jgi:hypothetical protein